MDVASPLPRFLAGNYAIIKSQFPSDYRRRLNLRAICEFWNLSPAQKSEIATSLPDLTEETLEAAPFVTDADPFDAITRDSLALGLLLRTDYSDDNAWSAFHTRLQDGEKEFRVVASDVENDVAEDGPAENMEQGEDSDDEDEDEDAIPTIFHVVNPSSPEDRAVLVNISNINALRLFNDVDIRKAPLPSPGTARVKPPHRLVDHDGWQEIYTGKNIWIYDAKSNIDQCVRVVGQTGDIYGTATGDSWRARVSHICELQVNIYSGAIKVDFGGLDRWDHGERTRNLQDALRT